MGPLEARAALAPVQASLFSNTWPDGHPVQRASSPPRERTVVEGNIVEHPIWKLSNRQARPKRIMVDKETGKVLTDPQSGKPREYVDPEDYTEVIDLGPDPTDLRKRRQLVIKADIHAGFPTVHAFRVLVVIVEKAHALGYASQKVPITPTQIANGLGLEAPGGKDYESIYNSLDALENVQLCFVDTYYDVTVKSVHPGRRTERLVKKSVFKLGGPGRARAPRRDAGEDGPASAVIPNYPQQETLGDALEPEDYVELGDGLWRSLTAGYRFAVDRMYLNGLPTETALRLYSYLAKKDYKSRFYEERVVGLGRRLGLAKTAPSDIRASLEPACEALLQPLGAERKAFLRAFSFEGTRAQMKLCVETNREQDEGCPTAERGREVVDELRKRFMARR
jgi:hypothetical protein